MENNEPLRRDSDTIGVRLDNSDEKINKGYGQLSQSRSAILSAVVIIFILDILALISIIFPEEDLETRVILRTVMSAVLDLFLGINLLRGKNWARTWMLVRLVGGIVIFGVASAIQSDFGTLLINTGVLLALILLLTGTSTRLRITGGIALAVIAFIIGMIISVVLV